MEDQTAAEDFLVANEPFVGYTLQGVPSIQKRPLSLEKVKWLKATLGGDYQPVIHGAYRDKVPDAHMWWIDGTEAVALGKKLRNRFRNRFIHRAIDSWSTWNGPHPVS